MKKNFFWKIKKYFFPNIKRMTVAFGYIQLFISQKGTCVATDATLEVDWITS